MNYHDYEHDFMVPYSKCDYNGNIRLSEILGEAQNISMEHCETLGLNTEFYDKVNRAFLMAKISGKIHRYPVAGEVIRVYTKPFEPFGPQYPRVTRFYDKEGNLLIECDARWILIDTKTFKISRDPADKEFFPFDKGEKPVTFKQTPIEPLHKAEEVEIRYSMVDINDHLNNAVYADVMCDCIEKQLYSGKEIEEFQIYYHNEAPSGSKLIVNVGNKDNDYYFKGNLKDDVCCFEANVALK